MPIVASKLLQFILTLALLHSRVKIPEFGAVSEHVGEIKLKPVIYSVCASQQARCQGNIAILRSIINTYGRDGLFELLKKKQPKSHPSKEEIELLLKQQKIAQLYAQTRKGGSPTPLSRPSRGDRSRVFSQLALELVQLLPPGGLNGGHSIVSRLGGVIGIVRPIGPVEERVVGHGDGLRAMPVRDVCVARGPPAAFAHHADADDQQHHDGDTNRNKKSVRVGIDIVSRGTSIRFNHS